MERPWAEPLRPRARPTRTQAVWLCYAINWARGASGDVVAMPRPVHDHYSRHA